jgi:hypothetical protein
VIPDAACRITVLGFEGVVFLAMLPSAAAHSSGLPGVSNIRHPALLYLLIFLRSCNSLV